VGVVSADGVESGTTGNATVMVSGIGVNSSYTFEAMFDIREYEATYESIYEHDSPSWYNDAKFGILIHWVSIFPLPQLPKALTDTFRASTPSPAAETSGKNETYAEWYWWNMNKGPNTTNQTYKYNLATYGPGHVYDDFIQNFTALAFNPKDWVDVFANAGAKY
jgi:alpha-L-fucosidase